MFRLAYGTVGRNKRAVPGTAARNERNGPTVPCPGIRPALLALARDIRDGVRKAFDVELHPEPVLVNCSL